MLGCRERVVARQPNWRLARFVSAAVTPHCFGLGGWSSLSQLSTCYCNSDVSSPRHPPNPLPPSEASFIWGGTCVTSSLAIDCDAPPAHTHARASTNACVHMHARTCARTYARTHAHVRARPHVHTCRRSARCKIQRGGRVVMCKGESHLSSVGR